VRGGKFPEDKHTVKIREGEYPKPDLFFPGHDIQLMEKFPKVAEDITRLA